VRPGITDPASLVYRHEEEILSRDEDLEPVNCLEIFADQLAQNLGYIPDISFRSDLRIIFATVSRSFLHAESSPHWAGVLAHRNLRIETTGKQISSGRLLLGCTSRKLYVTPPPAAPICFFLTHGGQSLFMKREYARYLPHFVFHRRPWFIFIFQAVVVFISLVLAWLLRFDFSLPYRRMLFLSGVSLVVVRLLTLRLFHLNHGWWHFASVSDAMNILKAVATGSLAFYVLNRYAVARPGFPRSVYLLEAILTACLLGGARLASRVLVELVRRDSATARRVLLVGAGFAAQMVIRELARPKSGYVAVGCVDDDPSKLGIHILGVPVLGSVEELESVLEANSVDEILIAIPSARGKQMQRITEICQRTQLPFKTVPTLSDLIRGDATVSQFREVRLEDLLGRQPVQIDLEAVRAHLRNKNVVVTGAAGSIGSELCRQILDYTPCKLVCIDQDETGIFYLQQELQRRSHETQLVCRVADVSDAECMRRCLSEHQVEHIFHAAAYKHVSVMEENVTEAIRNNVFTLQNLLDIAEEQECKSFVLISSDKAVNPTGVMGSSKRIGELMLAARPNNKMRCVSVRFGNVLGSSGSVVPILQEQLRLGRALTITHPEIRRFFMTTQEAVSLVLQASTIGHHSDILVLEMGTPVRIVDLARALIRLSGKSEDSIEIQFIGLREGEKLEEELFYRHEKVLPTTCDKIKRINGTKPDWAWLCRQLEQLRASMTVDGLGPIRARIQEIIPEYRYTPELGAEPQTEPYPEQRCRNATAQD
jgi:FlaA1/EpsC-like NDP-sugar epimerase